MVGNKNIFEIKDFSIYYGDFHGGEEYSAQHRDQQDYRNHWSFRLRKINTPEGSEQDERPYPHSRIEGQVLFQGVNIYDKDTDVIELRRRVGMVFQKPNPFPSSVYENVAYGPRLRGIKKKGQLDEIVENALVKADLWKEVKDKLNEPGLGLSGGQMQRLCIARSLAQEPEVILFDEPTSALDPISTAHIENLLQELEKTVTIVIVTHNMQQAARISNYTAFMYIGELVEFGDTNTIFVNPANKLTEEYITGRFG